MTVNQVSKYRKFVNFLGFLFKMSSWGGLINPMLILISAMLLLVSVHWGVVAFSYIALSGFFLGYYSRNGGWGTFCANFLYLSS